MSEWLTLIFVLGFIYAVSGGRRFGQLSLISLFVYAQGVMAAGTIPDLDPSMPADVEHLTLIISTYSAIVVVAIGGAAVTRHPRKAYNPEVDFTYPRRSVWFLIIFSLGVSILYFANVGYFALFESIESIVAGTNEDVAGLRLESYSGSRYFYPGYVNQFKNALLPALTLVVLIAAFRFKTPGRLGIVVILIPAALLMLLGTGQRGAFVMVIIMALVSVSLIAPKKVAKYAVRIALVGVPLFFLSTFASGRAGQQLAAAGSIGEQIGIMFNQLLFRFTGSNQESSIAGFRFIYGQPIEPLSEWGRAIVGLLPGQSGSDLAHQIFAQMYGTTRGTAPLSLWGSVYYNLGMAGAVVFAVLMTVAFCGISAKANSATNPTTIQIMGISGVTACLAMWIADGPTAPLNTGIGIYILLWWWGSRIRRDDVRPGWALPAPDERARRKVYSRA